MTVYVVMCANEGTEYESVVEVWCQKDLAGAEAKKHWGGNVVEAELFGLEAVKAH